MRRANIPEDKPERHPGIFPLRHHIQFRRPPVHINSSLRPLQLASQPLNLSSPLLAKSTPAFAVRNPHQFGTPHVRTYNTSTGRSMALLKAARVADVPTLDVVVPDHLAAAAARVLGTCCFIRRPRVSTLRSVDRPAITCDARALRATADAESAAAMKRQQRGAGRRFAVIGHRGKGMNALASPDRRLQEVKENSVRSFNEAARFAVDYVEFDVQV